MTASICEVTQTYQQSLLIFYVMLFASDISDFVPLISQSERLCCFCTRERPSSVRPNKQPFSQPTMDGYLDEGVQS